MTLPEILALLGQFGPSGVFAVLWWLERDERKEAQKANGVMFERALTTLVETKNTVATLKEIFTSGRAG